MFSPSLRHRWIAMITVCCLAVPAVIALAQSGKEAKGDAAHQQMMEAMMKAGTPGPQHEKLKVCEGTWKAIVKTWMGPGEPAISEGKADMKMILGGRFLEQRFTGTMMDMPFEGYGLEGYDNVKKAYTSFWIDNSSTSTMLATGSYDDAKKMSTFKTTGPGPDGKPVTMRMTNVMSDDNTMVFTMYTVDKGKEAKMMEITYTRM